MTGPADPFTQVVHVGRVFDIDRQIGELRAALHEPLPAVTSQDTLARAYTTGLLDQPGIVTDENRDAIAAAIMCLAGQLAMLAAVGGCGPTVVNVLSMAGLHLHDGDL